MKPNEPQFGSLTFITAIAIGIPVGTVIARMLDIESFFGGLFIVFLFSGLGGIIGWYIDKKLEVKQKANSGDN